jgi:hypothetical protein
MRVRSWSQQVHVPSHACEQKGFLQSGRRTGRSWRRDSGSCKGSASAALWQWEPASQVGLRQRAGVQCSPTVRGPGPKS